MVLATFSGSTDTKSDVARICAADKNGARMAGLDVGLDFPGPASNEIGSKLSRRDFQLRQSYQLLRQEFLCSRCRVTLAMHDDELILQQAPAGKSLALDAGLTHRQMQFTSIELFENV